MISVCGCECVVFVCMDSCKASCVEDPVIRTDLEEKQAGKVRVVCTIRDWTVQVQYVCCSFVIDRVVSCGPSLSLSPTRTNTTTLAQLPLISSPHPSLLHSSPSPLTTGPCTTLAHLATAAAASQQAHPPSLEQRGKASEQHIYSSASL